MMRNHLPIDKQSELDNRLKRIFYELSELDYDYSIEEIYLTINVINERLF